MISITGYKEVDDVLKNLPKAFQDSAIASANMKAAKPLVEKEKLLAPEGPTGNLVDSIGAVRRGKRGNEVGEVWVGPQRRGTKKGFAGHLVEFGTRRRRNRKGANRGTMPKKPFAKPAFNQKKERIQESIRGELSKAAVRTMKRFLR